MKLRIKYTILDLIWRIIKKIHCSRIVPFLGFLAVLLHEKKKKIFSKAACMANEDQRQLFDAEELSKVN